MQLAKMINSNSRQGLKAVPRKSDGHISTLQNPQGALLALANQLTDAGVYVDKDTALKLEVYFQCIRMIATTVLTLSGSVVRRSEQAADVTLPNYQSTDIWTRNANDYMSANHWKMLAVTQALIDGNHYSEIIRDNNQRPIALIPIKKSVKPKVVDGQKIYVIGKNERTIVDRNMFHLFEFTTDGIVGLNRVQKHKLTISKGLAVSKFEGDFYRKGALTGGVLTLPADVEIDDEEMDEFGDLHPEDYDPGDPRVDTVRSQLEKRYTGSKNFHNIMILEEGMTYEQLQVSLADAQHLANKVEGKKDVAGLFGIPPFKIGITDANGYKTAEEVDRHYNREAILPWIVCLELEADRKLRRFSDQDVFHEMNMDDLYRGDLNKLYERYAIALGSKSVGFMGWEEVRKKLRLGPTTPDKIAKPINQEFLNESQNNE